MPSAESSVRGRVVAVLLTHGDTVCLLRRSEKVGSDRGRWHCVTGYLVDSVSAEEQALVEVAEETGLRRADLVNVTAGSPLCLADSRGGAWIVYPYRCEVRLPVVTLNWENDAVRWVRLMSIGDLAVVDWLHDVVAAVRVNDPDTRSDPCVA